MFKLLYVLHADNPLHMMVSMAISQSCPAHPKMSDRSCSLDGVSGTLQHTIQINIETYNTLQSIN